jgi:diguanylate cyclase (GGDEF)-like protein
VRPRILIVDDEKHIRKVLTLQLEAHGYRVETAGDGVEALDKVEVDPPDLILLDVMMPRMDGYEVCRRLRRNFRTSQIPIIILTAKDQLPEKVTGLEGGANDYVTKPFAMAEVLLRIKNVLSWSQLQRQANPLTGLPGNLAIEQELETRIQQGVPFAFVYADMDNFKAFNDYYGYNRGDKAIRMMAQVLTEAVQAVGKSEDFVGHIGGDDFVLIAAPERVDALCKDIIERFDRSVDSICSQEDVHRGYIEVANRRGEMVRTPLLTVTLAVVTSEQCPMTHIVKISDVASELKAYGKTFEGSVVVKERRRE